MMKIVQLPLIIALSFLAIACTSDEDDELLEVVYDEELHEDGIVDPSSKYAFTLEGDYETDIILKGDIGEVIIEGTYNWIVIEKDTHIEKLTITGEWNTVAEGDHGVTIDEIKIIGNDNDVRISKCVNWTANGERNEAPGADDCDTSDL